MTSIGSDRDGLITMIREQRHRFIEAMVLQAVSVVAEQHQMNLLVTAIHADPFLQS